MAITGFSVKFDRELDAVQYLHLLGYEVDKDPELRLVDRNVRSFVHEDIMCPSCGVRGAVLVSGAKNQARTKIVKQPHFRFISNDGVDIHDELCDLREVKQFNDISTEKIRFSSSRSNATRLIAEYVSKAISNGIFNRIDIANFRVWHLNIKKENLVNLSMNSDKLYHYFVVNCRVNKENEIFHPKMGELERLNWNIYGLNRISERNKKLCNRILEHKSVYIKYNDVDKLINKQNAIFDVRTIDSEYELLLKVKSFILRNVGVNFKTKYESSFLDAFSGLLLYVSDWSYEKALAMFIDIFNAPKNDEPFLDNIVALNPFKDFEKIRTILNINDVQEMLLSKEAFDMQLEKEINNLKYEYNSWKIQ